MPIKPENKSLYPADWDDISRRIREERADNKCERCGVRNHSVGYRDKDGNFIPCSGNVTMEDFGQGIDPNTSKLLSYKDALEMAEWQTDNDEYGYHYIVIVLTVAHKDHNPANCADENLAAWCQKCHNSYDSEHRKLTRRITDAMKDTAQLVIELWKENPITIIEP